MARSRSRCSSTCLALGAPGDWRSQTSVLTVLPSRRFNSASSRSWSASVRVFVNVAYIRRVARVMASAQMRSMTLIDGNRIDCRRRSCDERLGQHDALVGLPREGRQRLPGGTVVPHGKGPEPEHGLQFDQVFPACLDPLPIHRPRFRGDLELRGHQPQQRRGRWLVCGQDHARMAHVAELDGKAQPVGGSATLTDDGEVVFAEGVVPG